MANPHKGEVAFEANGERYVLQFSIDAICALEAETGKGIIGLVAEFQDPDKMSVTLARQILWAGLREHHPELSVKEAGELIPAAGGIAELIKLFGEAFSASFPQPKANGSRPQKAGSPRNGIGPHSTVTGAVSGGTTNPSGEKHPDK